jgi:hypothetical protein
VTRENVTVPLFFSPLMLRPVLGFAVMGSPFIILGRWPLWSARKIAPLPFREDLPTAQSTTARVARITGIPEAIIVDPLHGGHVTLFHCGWVYDHDSDIGGFTSGEFLLRDDGALYTRSGSDTYSRGQHSYQFRLWAHDYRWRRSRDTGACLAWMRVRGYDLYEPGPVPIDRSEAGPFAGMPPTPRPFTYPPRD